MVAVHKVIFLPRLRPYAVREDWLLIHGVCMCEEGSNADVMTFPHALNFCVYLSLCSHLMFLFDSSRFLNGHVTH